MFRKRHPSLYAPVERLPRRGSGICCGRSIGLPLHTISVSIRPSACTWVGGAQLTELKEFWDRLAAKKRIVLAGYRPDAGRLLEGTDLCVVHSVWQDAFPLAVLEMMARGKPVIAPRVGGGIPEMIEDGVTGILVRPGDENQLGAAIRAWLHEPGRARLMGAKDREKAAKHFTPEGQAQNLHAVLEKGFQTCEGASECR